MSAVKRCTWCHELSDPRAERCWVCGGSLVAEPAPAAAPADRGDRTLRLLGWLGLLGGIAFVSLLVAFELAWNWPGLLVPFAFVMLLVFGGLGRTAWLHLKGAPSSKGSTTTEEVVQGVAIAVTVTIVILALLVLLALAAVVLFMMVCFAIIAVSMH